jgi:hypothetical protein
MIFKQNLVSTGKLIIDKHSMFSDNHWFKLLNVKRKKPQIIFQILGDSH